MMNDLKPFVEQVLKNCDISDSRHAGLFSVCGLALRLRDLYKWEKGLAPWEEKDYAEVLAWIDDKEDLWGRLSGAEYAELLLFGRAYDPFDTGGINAVLAPQDLFYGAGHARSLKPTFFLAQIVEASHIDGQRIYTLGRELARDLFTIPALTQDEDVVLRTESAKLFLWDQIAYIKESGRPALRFALSILGISDDNPQAIKGRLAEISDACREMYVYHEIGEIREPVFDRRVWREIIAEYAHTPVELLARAVKDLLADTDEHGTLPHIINTHNRVALGLYVSFFDGLRKALFPELRQAFTEFADKGDWSLMESCVASGRQRAREMAQAISKAYEEGRKRQDMAWAQRAIEKLLPEDKRS